MTEVVVIGDAVVDVLEEPDGSQQRYPGGAALNTAVGLAILGHDVTQVAALGLDRDGFWLERHLRDHGVRLIRSRSCDFTGRATSRRVDGEPTYTFDDALSRRRLSPPDRARDLASRARAVVVNSYPFDDAAQVVDLLALLDAPGPLRAVDPNPRPALMRDHAAYRAGFEAVLPHVDLVKLSEQDLALLYDGSEDDVVRRLRDAGAPALLLTRGARGASLLRADRPAIDVAAVLSAEPVVDALGAGDASLAAFVSGLLQLGEEPSDAGLEQALRFAMTVAAATTRHRGGRLRLPDPEG
jgi:fructokinase